MQGSSNSNNSGNNGSNVSGIIKQQQQQQQNQAVRYHNQYYKYQKQQQIDPTQQYQLHQSYQMQQQQTLQGMQMPSQQPLLHHQQQQHQQQQYQHNQQINATIAPDYQINNMFAKLSVSDIQLSQSVNMNQMQGVQVAKPQPMNRKLFIKQNNASNINTSMIMGTTTTSTANINNDLINSSNTNALNVPPSSSSNIFQGIDMQMQHNSNNMNVNDPNNIMSFQSVTQTSQSNAYQTIQVQQQDSLFTRSIDNFDITNRINQSSNNSNTNEGQQHVQQQQNNFLQNIKQQIPQTHQQLQQQTQRFQVQQHHQQLLQHQTQQYSTLAAMSGGMQANNSSGDFNYSLMSPARQQQLSGGAQTNRPQSAVSFTQNSYSRSASSGSTTTRRQQSAEPVVQQNDANSHEVIISNIDRDTVGHIIHELHSHGVQDLNYKLIEQQIFIVKFKNKESADWAIEKYDGQEINGMKLQVRQVIQEKKFNRLRTRPQFLPLQGILESNENGDEDVGSDGSNNSNRGGGDRSGSGSGGNNESTSTNTNKNAQNNKEATNQLNQSQTPDLSQIKMNMLAQQRATTPKISNESIQGTAVGYGSTNKYSAQIQNNSISPNASFQQNQMMQQSMTARKQGYIAQSIHDQYQSQVSAGGYNSQNQQQLQYNGGGSLNFGQNQNPYEQFGNIQSMNQSYYQQVSNPIMNKQISPGQMSFQQLPQQTQMTNFSQYHQNMQNLKRSSSGGILKIQNKLAHTMMSNSNQLDLSSRNVSSEYPGQQQLRKDTAINKNLSFQANTHKFKSEDFDEKNQDDNSDKYSAAFGYNSSGSGLLIQQQPQQNMHQSFLENHPSFGKISESIDDSQNDDINVCQINYDVSNGSERESINNQTMRNIQNTQTVKNISTRSNSDHSHQITHQIMVQQYQSPESNQKLAMTQRINNLNNSLDYMGMSNSGRDSPPRFSTPGSKQNNSFHHFGSSQNLSNYIRINNEMPTTQQNQGPYHARNFSAEQQFYQSELMQQQLYLPQALNQSHLNHSMSMQSMQQFPTSYYNYLSTSQDLNNISLYGQPMSLNQQLTLSASNSSVDLASTRLSIQNQNKKQSKGSDQQKSHQQLKSAYKESSEPVNEEYYSIDDNKIKTGQDMRTTVMVKNIPNKYKQKNLLDEINQNNKGKYDFVYLPIDFQNNANIGYAFVNFLNPLFILEFKEEFENRRWRRFQSQKKCELKYGRLQGIAQLSQHFQNSTVSNQVDVQVRPRVFDENTRKDWTKEIHRLCNKYKLNPQIFLNFKSNNTQQTLSTKPDAGSNVSVNSQQNINNQSQVANMSTTNNKRDIQEEEKQ